MRRLSLSRPMPDRERWRHGRTGSARALLPRRCRSGANAQIDCEIVNCEWECYPIIALTDLWQGVCLVAVEAVISRACRRAAGQPPLQAFSSDWGSPQSGTSGGLTICLSTGTGCSAGINLLCSHRRHLRIAAAWLRSDLRRAAVNEELDASDVAAVVRGEEHDGLGDFVRRANAPQGCGGGCLCLHLRDLLVGQSKPFL